MNRPTMDRYFSIYGRDHNHNPCEIKITLSFPELTQSDCHFSPHQFSRHAAWINFESEFFIDGQYISRSNFDGPKDVNETLLKQKFPQYSKDEFMRLNDFLINNSPRFFSEYAIDEKCLTVKQVARAVISPKQSFLRQCITQCEAIYPIEIVELFEITNGKAKKDIRALQNNRNIYPSSPMIAQCYELGFYYPYIKDITNQGYDVRLSKLPLEEPYFPKYHKICFKIGLKTCKI